jgi:hypothetical protein
MTEHLPRGNPRFPVAFVAKDGRWITLSGRTLAIFCTLLGRPLSAADMPGVRLSHAVFRLRRLGVGIICERKCDMADPFRAWRGVYRLAPGQLWEAVDAT